MPSHCPPKFKAETESRRQFPPSTVCVFEGQLFCNKDSMSWKGDTPFTSSGSPRASKELVTMLGSVIFLLRKLQCLNFFCGSSDKAISESNGKYISTWNLKYLFYRNGCCNWMIKHLFYRNGFCNWMIKHLYLGSTCFYHLHPFETCWFRDL